MTQKSRLTKQETKDLNEIYQFFVSQGMSGPDATRQAANFFRNLKNKQVTGGPESTDELSFVDWQYSEQYVDETVAPVEEHVSAHGGSCSVFQENVNYFMSTGMSPLQAKHRAIDYWRRYTRREVVETEEFPLSAHEDEDSLSPEQHYRFCELVSRARKILHPTEFKFLCLVIRQQDLDRFLNPSLTAVLEETIGDAQPESIQDIGVMCGYKVRENGSCTSILRNRADIQRKLKEAGISLM